MTNLPIPLDAQSLTGAFAAANHRSQHYCTSWWWRDPTRPGRSPYIACTHEVALEVELAA